MDARLDGINVTMTGEGAETLVLVHGIGCALEDWSTLLPLLSGRCRCIAIDLPGHGASRGGEPSIAAQAKAVTAVKQALAGPRTFLVGHSLGAKVVREAACQDPAGISGLVLIDGALYEGDCVALARTMAGEIDAQGFSAYARQHFSLMFDARFPAAQKAAMIARAEAMDPVFARALYLDAILFDAARSLETLATIGAPMLALQSTVVELPHGRRSLREGEMTSLMRAVVERAAQGSAKVIPDAGHFTMIDAPGAVAREIHAFLDRVR